MFYLFYGLSVLRAGSIPSLLSITLSIWYRFQFSFTMSCLAHFNTLPNWSPSLFPGASLIFFSQSHSLPVPRRSPKWFLKNIEHRSYTYIWWCTTTCKYKLKNLEGGLHLHSYLILFLSFPSVCTLYTTSYSEIIISFFTCLWLYNAVPCLKCPSFFYLWRGSKWPLGCKSITIYSMYIQPFLEDRETWTANLSISLQALPVLQLFHWAWKTLWVQRLCYFILLWVPVLTHRRYSIVC